MTRWLVLSPKEETLISNFERTRALLRFAWAGRLRSARRSRQRQPRYSTSSAVYRARGLTQIVGEGLIIEATEQRRAERIGAQEKRGEEL